MLPRVANELCLAGDGGAGGEAFEAKVVCRIDGLFVEFGEQDMRDRADDAFGRAFNEIGEADEDLAFAEANGGVQGCEAAEANREGRHRRSRAQGSIFLLKNGRKLGSHHV